MPPARWYDRDVKRALCIAAVLACFGPRAAIAQPGQEPAPRAPGEEPEPEPTSPAEPAAPAQPVPDELRVAEEAYQLFLRHRLPRQATQIIDGAVDLANLYYELPAIWQSVQDDPALRAMWSQLKLQYKPVVHWSTYAGGLAESTGYTGVTAGVAVDVTAPLCRYIGAAANTHGYYYNGAGISYDTRGTVCLPWGPFSLEFGLLRQRELRVGISSAPSLPSANFNSDGFEMRIRSYRWIDSEWEGQVTPMDVVFRTYSVPGDSSIPESSAFQVEGSFFRYLRYGRGFLGANRQVDAIHVDVVGQEDTQVAQMSTTVVSVSPVKWSGARLADQLYLDGYLGFSQGRITDLTMPALEDSLENFFFFATGFELNYGNPSYQATLRYRRRLLPDSDFRLLAEDRVDMVGQLVRQFDMTSLSVYGALTAQAAAPPGTEALPRTPSYGVEGKFGRYLIGPFYLQLTATTARSYYASIDGARLLNPELEFRALASLIASDSNY